ncbi:MAG: hypothetical protein EXS18_07195 [Verrucomicrobiae bacterium]|nr:hypothetical protein [Verrucomicrobiae bacterium]
MDITFNCDKCGQSLVVDSQGAGITIKCPKCGRALIVPDTSTSTGTKPPYRTQKPRANYSSIVSNLPPLIEPKYKMLRFLVPALKVLAVVSVPMVIGSQIVVFPFLSQLAALSPQFPQLAIKLLLVACGIIMAGFSFVSTWACAEGIQLAIDVEENTRSSRLDLERVREKLEEKSV